MLNEKLCFRGERRRGDSRCSGAQRGGGQHVKMWEERVCSTRAEASAGALEALRPMPEGHQEPLPLPYPLSVASLKHPVRGANKGAWFV